MLSFGDQAQHVQDLVLQQLPWQSLLSLGRTCRSLRAAVRGHPGRAQQPHCPSGVASHPLMQTPCARAFLDLHHRAHSNLMTGCTRLETYSTAEGLSDARTVQYSSVSPSCCSGSAAGCTCGVLLDTWTPRAGGPQLCPDCALERAQEGADHLLHTFRWQLRS